MRPFVFLAVVLVLLAATPLPTVAASVGWTIQPVTPPATAPRGSLTSIGCPAVDCVAVGSYANGAGIPVTLAEHWNGAAWVIHTTPNPDGATTSRLQGVACATASACVGVGYFVDGLAAQHTLAEGWDGNNWSILQTPSIPGGTLQGVACSAPLACTAVGEFATGSAWAALAERWDGQAWTVQRIPEPAGAVSSTLSGVSCASTVACIAVGDYVDGAGNQQPLVVSWDGLRWALHVAAVPLGATAAPLTAVACTSDTSCLAVGHASGNRIKFQAFVEQWNGASWSVQATPSPNNSTLFGIGCSSPRACTAVGEVLVGNVPLIESWDGATWTLQTPPNVSGGRNSVLKSVSCPTVGGCSAVGSFVNSAGFEVTLVEHQQSSTWVVQPSPNASGATLSSLADVSCVSSSMCIAVGDYQTPDGRLASLAEGWDGVRWSRQLTPNPAGMQTGGLAKVSCPTTSTCVAVGEAFIPGSGDLPLIERWDGGTWSVQSAALPAGVDFGMLHAVSCSSPGACTAVGFYGLSDGTQVPLIERWDGQAWNLQDSPDASGNGLEGVSCTSATWCIAVGGQTSEIWDGHSWSTQPAVAPPGVVGTHLASVSCASPTACTAVGDYDPVPEPHPGLALIERWDGHAWTLQAAPSLPGSAENPLSGISCIATTECTAVGFVVDDRSLIWHTLVEHWNGASWTVEPSPNIAGALFNLLGGVSCTAHNSCMAVGASTIDVTVPLTEQLLPAATLP
jgi:hypothetical protein